MQVKVRIWLSPERVVRNETLKLTLPQGATVGDLLGRLPLTPAEKKKYLRANGLGLKEGMGILVDRENVDLLAQGLDTPLKDGQVVSLIHLLAGG
ncbi:MAG: MoaD/ThiS family protein [Deltaproteobacteria bacterium]|nr:MoaD/ThiS family protein [Deltaproteobacteria bacterium]